MLFSFLSFPLVLGECPDGGRGCRGRNEAEEERAEGRKEGQARRKDREGNGMCGPPSTSPLMVSVSLLFVCLGIPRLVLAASA